MSATDTAPAPAPGAEEIRGEQGQGPAPVPVRGKPFEPGTNIGASTRFQKGQSGHAEGRPKGKKVAELEGDARDFCDTVFVVLKGIVLETEATRRDRIRAGELILAYGMGKPRQAITVSGEEGKPPVLVDSVTSVLERLIAAGGAGAVGGMLALPPTGGASGAPSPRGESVAGAAPAPTDTTNGSTP